MLTDSILLMPTQIMQNMEEFVEFLKYVSNKKLILEIGTARGGSLYWMMVFADANAEFVSIDLPGGKYGGNQGQPDEKDMQSWKKFNQILHIIRANSQDPETIEEVRKILNGRKFDLIFIDGDHSYNGVKQDFENYKEFASDIIAFHDITESNLIMDNEMIDVKKFWDEITGNKTEIIMDKNQGGWGIGILKL